MVHPGEAPRTDHAFDSPPRARLEGRMRGAALVTGSARRIGRMFPQLGQVEVASRDRHEEVDEGDLAGRCLQVDAVAAALAPYAWRDLTDRMLARRVVGAVGTSPLSNSYVPSPSRSHSYFTIVPSGSIRPRGITSHWDTRQGIPTSYQRTTFARCCRVARGGVASRPRSHTGRGGTPRVVRWRRGTPHVPRRA